MVIEAFRGRTTVTVVSAAWLACDWMDGVLEDRTSIPRAASAPVGQPKTHPLTAAPVKKTRAARGRVTR